MLNLQLRYRATGVVPAILFQGASVLGDELIIACEPRPNPIDFGFYMEKLSWGARGAHQDGFEACFFVC